MTEPDYNKLLPEFRDSLRMYIEGGYPPGGFLTAVLQNDLSNAIGRADKVSLLWLPSIVRWIYNEAPSACWGSPEKVSAWIRSVS